MRQKIYPLILMGLIIFIAGCTSDNAPYRPTVDFSVSKTTVNLVDNQLSDLIDIDLVKLDDKNIPATFDVLFIPSNAKYLTVFDDSGKPVEKMSSRTLKSNGAADKLQFKILGKKAESSSSTDWTLDISLYYNDTEIDKKTLSITVN